MFELGHEFDSSQTCNYCGVAAERTASGTRGNGDPCPAKGAPQRQTPEAQAQATAAAGEPKTSNDGYLAQMKQWREEIILAERRRCHAAALEVAKRFDGGNAKKAHRDMAKGARAAAQAILEGT